MKKIIQRAIWLALTAGLLLAALRIWSAEDRARSRSEDLPLTVERLSGLSTLTTLRVNVADARVTQIYGYIGSAKAVLVVHGEVTLGLDLSEARFESVDTSKHQAVLVVGKPKVRSVALDQERTRLLGVWESGLWRLAPAGEDANAATVNLAYRDAQRALVAVAADPELVDRSRQQAELVLKTFCGALKWTIYVRWE